jgi:hypothetical protein
MIQQKLPDPSGKRPYLWTSPMRDLAHIFPLVVAYAADFTREQLKREGGDPERAQELEKHVQMWQAFVHGCVNPENKHISDVYTAAAFESDSRDYVSEQFNKWMIRVLIGMYFKGVREATHSEEIPYGIEHVAAAMDAVRSRYRNECSSWLARTWNRLFGHFHKTAP